MTIWVLLWAFFDTCGSIFFGHLGCEIYDGHTYPMINSRDHLGVRLTMVQVKKMGRAVSVEVLDSSKHLKFMVFSIESDAI